MWCCFFKLCRRKFKVLSREIITIIKFFVCFSLQTITSSNNMNRKCCSFENTLYFFSHRVIISCSRYGYCDLIFLAFDLVIVYTTAVRRLHAAGEVICGLTSGHQNLIFIVIFVCALLKRLLS